MGVPSISATSLIVYIGNQEDQRTSVGSRTETTSAKQISPTSQTGLQKWLLCYLFIIATYTVHGKIWLGTFRQAIQVKAIGKENLANKL